MEINVNAKMVIILYMVYVPNVFRMRITNNKLRLAYRNVNRMNSTMEINVYVKSVITL